MEPKINEADHLAADVLVAASAWLHANTQNFGDAIRDLECAVRAREAYYAKLNQGA